jgi:hypothetical protein
MMSGLVGSVAARIRVFLYGNQPYHGIDAGLARAPRTKQYLLQIVIHYC